MKKSIFFLVIAVLLSSCLSLEVPQMMLPEEYIGNYISINENMNSDDFGELTLFVVKASTSESITTYTIQMAFIEGITPESPIVFSDYSFDYEGRITARSYLNTNDNYHLTFKNTPIKTGLPAEQFIEYEQINGNNFYLEIGITIGGGDKVYKVTGIESSDDMRRISTEYISFHKNIENTKQIENERIIKESKEYYINKYVDQTINIAALGNYQAWWSEPQPFIGELMADGESIRFKSIDGTLLAKETIFLLTWDTGFMGELNDLTSTNDSDSDKLLVPNFTLNGDRKFAYFRNEGISQNLKNILYTYNIDTDDTVFLIDLETFDTSQLFLSMMTGGDNDVDVSFYLISE